MITLAFSQMVFFTASSLAPYGGDDGLTVQSRNTIAGFALMRDEQSFYYVVFGFLVVTYLLCRALIASRFGRVFRGARENAARVASLGYNVFRYQLVAYVIAGGFGGVSGFLLANATEFVSPAYMSWQRSGELVIMVLMGGLGTLYGAVLGAAAFVLAEEWLSGLTEHWKMIFGPLLILIVLFAAAASLAPPAGCREQSRERAAAEPRGVAKALRRIAGDRQRQPRGAPRRTARYHRPERRRQDDADQPDFWRAAAGRRPHRRSPAATLPPCPCTHARRSGSRAVSDHLVLPRFSALENVALAVQARSGSSFRVLRRADREAALNRPGGGGAGGRRARRAQRCAGEALVHGEQRVLELAIALATQPKLLLLDEPMAGIGHEETERLITVLRRAQGPLRHRSGGARHGRGVRARRPHLGAGLWRVFWRAGRRMPCVPIPPSVAAYLGDEME